MQIWMTDRDVLEKVARLTGKNIYSVTKQVKESHKPQYRISIDDQETLQKVLTRIYPYMGTRRKEAIESILGYIQDRQRQQKNIQLERAEARRLYSKGVARSLIAEMFGRSYSWVRDVIQER